MQVSPPSSPPSSLPLSSSSLASATRPTRTALRVSQALGLGLSAALLLPACQDDDQNGVTSMGTSSQDAMGGSTAATQGPTGGAEAGDPGMCQDLPDGTTCGQGMICVAGSCSAQACGDGHMSPGETCDDGNQQSGDGCSAQCTLERCGDGVQSPPKESCDDGNQQDGDGCSAQCQVEPTCGNGQIEPPEGCDDGNRNNGDGCNAFCVPESCGDGKVDSGEQCDDGNQALGDGCAPNCRVIGCGDGVVDLNNNEQCDDGNQVDGDGCSIQCQFESVCGNGMLEGGETCDDGNQVNDDGCSDSCQLEQGYCGDGIAQASEGCDDGNFENGDGCSSRCTHEQEAGACSPIKAEAHPARARVIERKDLVAAEVVYTDMLRDNFTMSCSCHTNGAGGPEMNFNALEFAEKMPQWLEKSLMTMTSTDHATVMPPVAESVPIPDWEGRSMDDPLKILYSQLVAWSEQGTPADSFSWEGRPVEDVRNFWVDDELSAKFTNIGTCRPDASLIHRDQHRSQRLDAFFEEATALPDKLSQTDFVSLDSEELAKGGVLSYATTYPLWTDNAKKQRYFKMPYGTKMKFDKKRQLFIIPENTRVYKTFLMKVKDADGKVGYKKMETRVILARKDELQPDGTYKIKALYGTYLWNEAETEAYLSKRSLRNGKPFADQFLIYTKDEGKLALAKADDHDMERRLEDGALRHYLAPGSARCEHCHLGSIEENFIVGFSPLQLNRRPAAGKNGILDVPSQDELAQMQNFLDWGLIEGLGDVSEIKGIEAPQAPSPVHGRRVDAPDDSEKAPDAPSDDASDSGEGSDSATDSGAETAADSATQGASGSGADSSTEGTATDTTDGGATTGDTASDPTDGGAATGDAATNGNAGTTTAAGDATDTGAQAFAGLDADVAGSSGLRDDATDGMRPPRNYYEVVAQGYMFGNCAHCHNPRGYASQRMPETKDILNFHPLAPQGGIYEFSLEAQSPRVTRKLRRDLQDPATGANLDGKMAGKHYMHYVSPSIFDTGTQEIEPPFVLDGKWYGPWRSLIYRNVETPYTYAVGSTGAVYPHMPMHSPGFDCRVRDIFAEWMLSIPARRTPEARSEGVDFDSNDYLANPFVDQPYESVWPEDPDYFKATRFARDRLRLFHEGEMTSKQCRYEESNPVSYMMLDPARDFESQRQLSRPPSSHILEYDFTEPPGPWLPRRLDWELAVLNQEVTCIDPEDEECRTKAVYLDEKRVVDLLASHQPSAELLEFGKTERPMGFWQDKKSCKFPGVAKVADLPQDQREPWMDEVKDAGKRLYMESPASSLYRNVCQQCHGDFGRSDGPIAVKVNELSGGRSRVANFDQGLFGSEDSGSNIDRVFGPAASDKEGIEARDLSRRYLIWMSLGGTRSSIHMDALKMVNDTRLYNEVREGLPAATDANMLLLGRQLCAEVLSYQHRYKVNNTDDSASAVSPARMAEDFRLMGDKDRAPFRLLSTGGYADRENWFRICTDNNPMPVRVMYPNGDSKNDWSKSTELFRGLEHKKFPVGAFFWPGKARYVSRQAIAEAGGLEGLRFVNQDGQVESGLSSSNLEPWCVVPPGVHGDAGERVGDMPTIAADETVASTMVKRAGLPGEPLPFCPKDWFKPSIESNAREGVSGLLRPEFEASEEAIQTWIDKGAINAGYILYDFIESLIGGDVKPSPGVGNCEALEANASRSH